MLISGANRGIGLELISQIVKLPSSPQHLFAACRNPEKAEKLKSLAKDHSNIHVIKINVDDEASIMAAKMEVENYLGQCGLNLLLNNAGIKAGLRLNTINSEDMLQVYKTNVVGPCLMVKAFLPLLKIAASKSDVPDFSCSRAAIINISSILGSVSCTRDISKYYDYDASKAALNMITKNMAVDLKSDKILSVAIHPGWVSTDMGGPNADIKPAKSAEGIIKVLSMLKGEHNGSLIEYTGKILPM